MGLLRDELNECVRRTNPSDTDVVQLSNVVDQDGTARSNLLALTLVNVEEETVGRTPYTYQDSGPASHRVSPSELKLNLSVLATGCIGADSGDADRAYTNSLKLLSKTIAFFQAKPVFTRANSPGMDTQLDKLIVNFVTNSQQDLNNLWACLGAKYMPSALYKIRVVAFAGDELSKFGTDVSALDQKLASI